MSQELPVISKRRVLEVLQTELELRLRAAQLAAADAYAGATHDEAKAEDRYDTRALEQSYLTAGQNARIAELRQLLTALHFYVPLLNQGPEVEPGALVDAVDGSTLLRLLLLPLRVGERLQVDGVEILVVGTAAPLAQALLGKVVGDQVRVLAAGATREVEILAVS